MLIDEKRFKELIRDAMELNITLRNYITEDHISDWFGMVIPPIGSILELNNYPYGGYKVETIHFNSDFEIDLMVSKMEEINFQPINGFNYF